jgi:hypothetical protein
MESPCGYVLRLTERNGYVSPFSLFGLAGISRPEAFNVQLSKEKLLAVLGTNGKYLKTYSTLGSTDYSQVELCGHSLAAFQLDLTQSKVCPDCVHELGYLPAWSELAVVDGCPTHNRKLLTSCPKCESKLGWYRAGLLACKCGYDLTDTPSDTLLPEHATLLSYIVSRFTGAHVTDCCGMPALEIGALSLQGLLSFLQNLALSGAAPDQCKGNSIASKASYLLGNWPGNLTDAIRKVGQGSVAARGTMTYRKLTAGVSAVGDMAILRNSPGLLSVATLLQSLEKNEPAKAEGRFERTVVSRAQTPDVATAAGDTASEVASRNHSARESAKLIGIPVSALVYLRKVRHYEVKNKSSRIATFHRSDALDLKNRLLALGRTAASPSNTGATVSLSKVLNRKFKFINGKGELIAAMLEGTLSTYGRQGPEVGDLLLGQDEAAAFVMRARAVVFDGKLTPTEASKLIDCDGLVIPGLVAAGYLEGARHAAGWRISADSVARFKEQYRPLVSVAKERGTSSRALARKALAAGIELMSIARPGGKGLSQPFIRLVDIKAL